MSFEENIKKWVLIDNQIKILNEKVRSLRSNRDNVNDSIQEYVKSQELREASVQISDGTLKFVESKSIQPISLQFVKMCLSEIINDNEQVEKIMTYIKQKRNYKTSAEIKRVYSH
tara:strand:+ start:184 stop:528 length:345 start_codon:yes stop_codon:yes gene_type:complete